MSDGNFNYHYYYKTSQNFGNLMLMFFSALQCIMYLINGIFKLSLEPWYLNSPIIMVITVYLAGVLIGGMTPTKIPEE